MSKEVELAAADALARDINEKHADVLARVESVKAQAAEIGALANEVGMALASAKDTVGASFPHWLREKVQMQTVTAERYMRHAAHYHPGQLFLPGFKAIEDRASIREGLSNQEEGGPTPQEHGEVSVRDIAAGWVYDARRWFSQVQHRLPPESMTQNQIVETLRIVKPVRDAIWAYEKRLVALAGGLTDSEIIPD